MAKTKVEVPNRFTTAQSEENSRRQCEAVSAILELHPDGQCDEGEWVAAVRATARPSGTKKPHP
jgi:hypothetical protein